MEGKRVQEIAGNEQDLCLFLSHKLASAVGSETRVRVRVEAQLCLAQKLLMEPREGLIRCGALGKSLLRSGCSISPCTYQTDR